MTRLFVAIVVPLALALPSAGPISASSAPQTQPGAKPLSVPAAARPGSADAAAEQALFNKYCMGCHNARTKSGDFVLEGLDLAKPSDHAEEWEKVVRKLRGGLMPPAGRPRPDEATYAQLRTSIETRLDQAAVARPDPGPHRDRAPPEPAGVRERRSRSARRRNQRARSASCRRFQLRVRQHRRRAEDVRCADGALSRRRPRSQSTGSRQPSTIGWDERVPRVGRAPAARAHRRAAVRHARRHARPPCLPPGRGVRHQGWPQRPRHRASPQDARSQHRWPSA